MMVRYQLIILVIVVLKMLLGYLLQITGSISMINDFGKFTTLRQSLAVYGNKLIVLVNNSHEIKIYDITENGLAMPGGSTNGSSPREKWL